MARQPSSIVKSCSVRDGKVALGGYALAGQLADYEVTGTVLEDGTIACLSALAPPRLGAGQRPVTIWALGPSARSPWPGWRTRLEAVTSVRGEGLPDWVEAGVSDWSDRSVVWVATYGAVDTSLLAPHPSMDVPARLKAVAQVARGAHALHEHGVLHGAICPQAVALSASEDGTLTAVLAPPSLADGQRLAVQVGYPSLGFVDPQLVRGEGGRWSDIWALGGVILWVTAGRAPFPGLDDLPLVQAVSQLVSATSVPLTDMPAPASELICACLSLDPTSRPPTAAEVARQAEEVAARWQS